MPYFCFLLTRLLLLGVLNVFSGCDGEVKIQPNMTEDDIESIF